MRRVLLTTFARVVHERVAQLTPVRRFANLVMSYSVDYFNARVLDEIESWPVGILADYARLIELLMEFGPDLRMPHSRAIGGGLFELRPRGREGIGRALYCYVTARRVVVLHAFLKKSRTTLEHDLSIARMRMKKVRDG
jgi:phage-related protein